MLAAAIAASLTASGPPLPAVPVPPAPAAVTVVDVDDDDDELALAMALSMSAPPTVASVRSQAPPQPGAVPTAASVILAPEPAADTPNCAVVKVRLPQRTY